jgi:hypothetical protein
MTAKSIDEMIGNLIPQCDKASKAIDTIQEILPATQAEVKKQIKISEENVKKNEEKKNVE